MKMEEVTNCNFLAPDMWFSNEMRPACADALEPLGRFLNTNSSNLVWVENASNAVNAVLRSFRVFTSNDTILYTDIAYGMVKETLYFLRDNYGVKLLEMPMPQEMTKQNILDAFQQTLDTNPSISFVTFCHITSIPAVLLPIKELTQMFHEKDIPVLIDGAHALGQEILDMDDLQADFYLANAHKWLFAPRGSAFLYILPKWQPRIQPPVVSFGYKKGIRREFEWIGTRDYSAWPATVTALEWYESFGPNTVRQYQKDLCTYANEYLTQLWNSQNLLFDEDVIPNSMTNIGLPSTTVSADTIKNELLSKYNIFGNVYQFREKLYTRLSCQIYNTHDDIHALGDAVLEIIQNNS